MNRALGIVCTVLLSALVACEGRVRVASNGSGARGDERAGPFIAVLDLSDGVPELPPSGWLGLGSRGASFDQFVREVDHLERAKEMRAVLVKLGAAHIGLARSTEVGATLATLRSKVPVWCHADDYSNGTLNLVAQGCTQVWASPASSVDAIGLAAQTVYFHKLLADDLGLDVDFLQVGRFKGAEEPFTRDGPSPQARQSLETTLADMRAVWLGGLRAGRPGAEESAAEDGPYTAQSAKARGLVDEVGYFDEAREALEKSSGASRSEVRLGAGMPSGVESQLGNLLKDFAGDSFGTAPIALVRAAGAISLEGGGLLGDGGGIVERKLAHILSRLERDDDVKAVILRIDSPGGSALASDLLWHQLMRIRAKKPLVASIGDMAASGGYYLASSASVVFADADSIVGSIGVVGGKIATDHALERIGVHAETFPGKTGDPHAAARAAYDSLFVPWDDATRARVLESMTGIYELFLARVSQGRGIAMERVEASAEGRIFSGRDGKARGLVDEIGGLREAIGRAKEMAGLPADARVAAADESPGLFQTLLEDEPEGEAQKASAAVILRQAAPASLAAFVSSVGPLAEGEHIVCALPFALTVR
ncbi:MAG: S49 family peptidase [Polyangiaceae bacterium]|jgi:protease IV